MVGNLGRRGLDPGQALGHPKKQKGDGLPRSNKTHDYLVKCRIVGPMATPGPSIRFYEYGDESVFRVDKWWEIWGVEV